MKTRPSAGFLAPLMRLRGRIARRLGRLHERRPSADIGAVVEPVWVKGQAAWNRSTRRAGERGGARVGKPKWARIRTITGGSTMVAIIFKAPPQFGQCSRSISKTRLSRHAQLRGAGEGRACA